MSSSAAIRRHAAKCGIGRITATADNNPPVSVARGAAPRSKAPAAAGPPPNARTAAAKTRLTRVRHSAPTRLVPMPLSSLDRGGGAALCALASYGGGMLRGDSSDLEIRVEGRGATLGVVTQGSTRIYRSSPSSPAGTSTSSPLHPDGESEATCRAGLRATVADGDGLLVVAPDPVVPYAGSSYVQSQRVDVAPGASAVLVDWFGAGRVVGGRSGGGGLGERWDMDRLSSSSALYRLGGDGGHGDDEVPLVVESVSLDNRRRTSLAGYDDVDGDDPFGFDMAAGGAGDGTVGGGGGPRFDAFASVLLHGPASEGVAARCRSLSEALAAEWTRVRRSGSLEDDDEEGGGAAAVVDDGLPNNEPGQSVTSSLGLGGRVLFSISRVECGEDDHGGFGGGSNEDEGESSLSSPNRTYVARLAASSNEDAYRILHSVLLPLRERFGYEFYRDRISASATRVPPAPPTAPRTSASVSSPGSAARNGTRTRTRGVASTPPPSESSERPPLQPLPRGDGSDNPAQWPPATPSKSWAALMLADSALPTGGFAHSSGIEVASQLGLFDGGGDVGADPTPSSRREGRVAAYVRASTRSAARLHAPFVVAGHRLVDAALSSRRGDDGAAAGSDGSSASASLDGVHRDWLLLDRLAHAVLSSNAPSCRASIDQGSGLLRVSTHWLRGRGGLGARGATATVGDDDASDTVFAATELLGRIQRSIVAGGAAASHVHGRGHGHAGPILGVACALLGLSADEGCDVLGYAAARDVVSAAVRLNLLGPLAGVTVLDGAREAARDGVEAALVAVAEAEMEAEEVEAMFAAGWEELVLGELGSRPPSSSSLLVAAARAAAGSAPTVDVVHPCHDLLSVRLFRT